MINSISVVVQDTLQIEEVCQVANIYANIDFIHTAAAGDLQVSLTHADGATVI
jgi:hypothetical protein